MQMASSYILYDLQEEIAKYSANDVNCTSIVQEAEIPKDNPNNKNTVRDEFRKLLMEGLEMPSLEATDLEIGVFNATIDYATSEKIQLSWKCQTFMDTYINMARSIYANLKQDSYIGNTNLKKRLLEEKEFFPHMLPYMMCQDIFPDRWKKIVEKNQLRFKVAYEVKQVAMTDQIQCSRCKSRKISYYELQTRAGDEAMTVFFSCLLCSKKWRM